VPMYLRGIEDEYAYIVSEAKANNADPSNVDLDSIMARVMESADHQRRLNKHVAKPAAQQQQQHPQPRQLLRQRSGKGKATRGSGPCKACGRPQGHGSHKCSVEHPEDAPPERRDLFHRKHAEWIAGKHHAKAASDGEWSMVAIAQKGDGSMQQLQEEECMYEFLSEPYTPKACSKQEEISSLQSTVTAYATERALSCVLNRDTWIVDSGATTHAVGKEQMVIEPRRINVSVKTASGDVQCTTRGMVILQMDNLRPKLYDTIVIPGLDTGLFSGCRALRGGLCFRPDLDALVSKDGTPIVTLQANGNLWLLVGAHQPRLQL